MTLVMVGVGAMGAALAARLTECGHDVIGVDPFVASGGEAVLSSEGTTVVPHLRDVVERGVRVSHVIVFVRLAGQVVAVLDELDADDRFGTVPVSILSTLSVADARAIAERGRASRPVTEAPVSGGVAGAREGTLTALVAGEAPPWLGDAAARVFTFAEYGQPAAAKLLNNAVGAANAHTLAAAVERSEQLGLPPSQMLDIVRASSGGGWMADHFFDFPVDLLCKDFHLLRTDAPIEFPATTADTDLPRVIAGARSRAGQN